MKAEDLQKKVITIEEIYKSIKSDNDMGWFKHQIPHYIFVSDEVKAQLINDGFKVCIGDWDSCFINSLIIEW